VTPLLATLGQLIVGATVCAIAFTLGAAWQSRSTAHWRRRYIRLRARHLAVMYPPAPAGPGGRADYGDSSRPLTRAQLRAVPAGPAGHVDVREAGRA